MLRNLLLALIGVSVVFMDDPSHVLLAENPYPRVIGPTGRPYGPTQAHYQYERQYARPWYGGPSRYDPNTGANFRVHGGWGGYGPNAGYYGYGYGPNVYGLPGYGFQFGWPQYPPVTPPPMLPLLPLGTPPQFSWQQPDALQQPQAQQPQPRQPGVRDPVDVVEARPVGPPEPVLNKPHNFMPVEPSTVAQRQRSLHLQGQGDIWFRQQNFLQAYSRYKQSAGAAADLAAPHFRMAYALMALNRFELAIPELQRGIRLDPQYPLRGESPEKVYGEENRLGAAALPQAVAAWVRQDIRSADRLFLLGALLTLSGDMERARVLLNTAAEFGGPAPHVVAYLKLTEQPAVAADAPQPVPADEQPPVPEAVEKVLKDTGAWLPARPLASRQLAPKFGTSPRTGTTPRTSVPTGPKPSPEALPKASARPSTVTAVEPAPVPVPKPAESDEAKVATEDDKAYPVEPGYVTIPKKGDAEKPADPPEVEAKPESKSEPEVVPAEATEPADQEGPVIPIPNSSN